PARPPRAPPPFPTRRSSDLTTIHQRAPQHPPPLAPATAQTPAARAPQTPLHHAPSRPHASFLHASSLAIPLWRSASPLLCYLCEDRKSTRLNSSHVKISYAV